MIISKGKCNYGFNVVHCTEFKIIESYTIQSKSLFLELHTSNLFSPEAAVASGSCVTFRSLPLPEVEKVQPSGQI